MSGYISNRKSKSGILTQFTEGIENNGQREQYGVVDDSPSRGKPSTRTSDADGRNIPETNLNVSTLLLLYAYSMKDLLYKYDFDMLFHVRPVFLSHDWHQIQDKSRKQGLKICYRNCCIFDDLEFQCITRVNVKTLGKNSMKHYILMKVGNMRCNKFVSEAMTCATDYPT